MRWTDMVGGRKFIITVLALVAVVFFVDVSGSEKVAFLGMIVGTHAAVNAAQKNQPPPNN